MNNLLFFAVLAASVVASAALAQTVVAPGAQLQKLSGDFAFTEGPTCDKSGNVFFTDQPNNRIMEWSTDGKLSVFMQPCGRANGMYFDAGGNLIACCDEKTALWSISPDKKVDVLVSDYQGKYLNGPNDVWISPVTGNLYITDPYYQRSWWDHTTMALPNEEVYFLSADHKTFKRLTDDLQKPNGITGTPDGKKLFVSDIGAQQTWSYDIQPDGSITNKTLFCKLGSDGMTIDEAGNIYITGHGLTVFDKTGQQIEHIPIHENWTANVCFGGVDRQTLFITASKSLYSIRIRYKGANPSK
jgi:gluconolactonase